MSVFAKFLIATLVHFCNLFRNTWRFVKKPFPLSLLKRNFYPKHLMG